MLGAGALGRPRGMVWGGRREAFEPVLMRWMKLEPIIQSEVS